MKQRLIRDVLDWPSQKSDFEPDGALRDIYIQNTTIEDWKLAVSVIMDGGFGARLERGGDSVAVPSTFESLFDQNDSHLLSFTVGGALLTCHFFSSDEIEFSLDPKDVSKTVLEGLLGFMIDIGDATKKPVCMTPENAAEMPIFRYDPTQGQLRWMPPRQAT